VISTSLNSRSIPRGATPLRSRSGQLCVGVRIGSTPRQALIDTGSKGLLIDPKVASRLPRVGKSRIRGVLGSMPTVRVRLPPVTFLGHRFTGLTAKVGPPSLGSESPWDLLLGTEVLLRRPLTLDFRRRLAWFEEKGGSIRTDEEFRLRYHRSRPFLTVKLGSHTLRSTLDTGCGSCLLNSRVRGVYARVVKTDTAVDSAGKRSKWTSYLGPALNLGRGSVGRFRFVRAPLELAEKGLGRPLDFVIGANVLRERGGVWTISRQPPLLQWSRDCRPS